MTDLKKARSLLGPLFKNTHQVIPKLESLVGRNQNPSTGDGSIHNKTWMALRDILTALQVIRYNQKRVKAEEIPCSSVSKE
jgi:hypothetical protein